MADALAGAVPLDPKNDVLSGAKSIPHPSVMDPNRGVDTLKRIGRAVTDPKTMNPLGGGCCFCGIAVGRAGSESCDQARISCRRWVRRSVCGSGSIESDGRQP